MELFLINKIIIVEKIPRWLQSILKVYHTREMRGGNFNNHKNTDNAKNFGS
jgi:hypothetical protein